MIMVNRGLEYLIILKEWVDPFDFIPDIEKATRTHLTYKTAAIDARPGERPVTWPIVVAVRQVQSDNRLIDSKYYAERAATWFEDARPRITSADADLQLSDRECELVRSIRDHPALQIAREGWFDVTEHVG